MVFHNRPFLLLIAAKVLQLVGLASISASVLFLVKYVIHGDESLIAAYGVSSGVASIASMPLWVKLGRFWDKRTIFILACLGFALVTLTWTFAGPGDGAVSLILRGAGAGIFSGGLLLMGQSILPDTIDFDCRRSGERREGIYAGAYSFVEKASSALGPLLVGAILQSFGFVAKAGNVQSAQAVTGIIIGASILPAAMYALSIVPLLRYDLKTHPGPSHSGPAQQAAA